MHPRQTITEIFATFVQFNGDRFWNWATDAKLRRSIQHCLLSPEDKSENFWVLYWYNLLQKPDSLAKQHLTAYLQETCYWASQKTVVSFNSTQYKLSDCFQIAIAQVDKVLKGFNPDQGSVLKNYANAVFNCAIRETLRQRHEVDICTPWGMLRKISQKRLVESLQAIGLSKDTIADYVLAWNCFKNLYVPKEGKTTRQLQRPNDKIWEAIAQAYNSQRSQQVTPQTLETWLLNAANYARKYLYPTPDSLNYPGGNESSKWLDNLPGSESVLTQLITQEEEQTRISQQAEINTLLLQAITQLESPAQQMLELWYRQKLTQQQIAVQLEIQQYSVSRRFTRIRETLIKALASWSQEKLHISLTPDILKGISTVIDEWLQVYYSSGC